MQTDNSAKPAENRHAGGGFAVSIPLTGTHGLSHRLPRCAVRLAPARGPLTMRKQTYLIRKGARYHFRRRLPQEKHEERSQVAKAALRQMINQFHSL